MLRPAPWIAAAATLALSACRTDMQDQPRYEVDSPSAFFADGRADRPLVKGVVARGTLVDDPVVEAGKLPDGAFVQSVPLPITRELLLRGRERYDVYCSPCHAYSGDGDGMIVQRGFKRPPSLHEPRLRTAAAGYVYDTIRSGFGVMPSYAAQVPVDDRWAITAYVRVLQQSQHVPVSELSPEERSRVEAAASAAASAARPDPESGHAPHGAGRPGAAGPPSGAGAGAAGGVPGAAGKH